MIADPIKTNEVSKLFVAGLGMGVGLIIICAALELTKK